MEEIDPKDNLIRLVNQYKNLVFSICLKLIGDYFVAEDITQETFINAYQHWSEFDGEQEKAWICRIASNKCIDYKREAARRSIPTTEEEMPEIWDTDNDPLNLYIGKDIVNNVEDICNRLPSPYREVARKHFVQGIAAKDIAKQNSMNLKTVQTQIYRAREMLKKSIRREELIS